MLQSLTIENFRAIQNLTLEDLGDINILVGKNNCGKTTVLEATNLLFSKNKYYAYEQLFRDRNITIKSSDDIGGIFYEFNINESKAPRIESKITLGKFKSIELKILPTYSSSKIERIYAFGDEDFDNNYEAVKKNVILQLELTLHDHNNNSITDIYRIINDSIINRRILQERYEKSKELLVFNTIFLTLNDSSISGREMKKILDNAVRLDLKNWVVESLRALDPNIIGFDMGADNAVYLRVNGFNQLIPIQLHGAGINRVLFLIAAYASCQSGIILIDEIDTGIHHSALADVWKGIFTATQTFKTQSFITTHSDECIKKMVEAAEQFGDARPNIKMYRIENKNGIHKVVPYTFDELYQTIDYNFEYR